MWQDGPLGITGACCVWEIRFLVQSCECWDSDKRNLSPCWRRDERKPFSLLWDTLKSLFLLYFECGLARRIMRNSQAPGWHAELEMREVNRSRHSVFILDCPWSFFPTSNTTCLIDKQHSDLPLLQRQMIWFSEIRGKKAQENIFGRASHFNPKIPVAPITGLDWIRLD